MEKKPVDPRNRNLSFRRRSCPASVLQPNVQPEGHALQAASFGCPSASRPDSPLPPPARLRVPGQWGLQPGAIQASSHPQVRGPGGWGCGKMSSPYGRRASISSNSPAVYTYAWGRSGCRGKQVVLFKIFPECSLTINWILPISGELLTIRSHDLWSLKLTRCLGSELSAPQPSSGSRSAPFLLGI